MATLAVFLLALLRVAAQAQSRSTSLQPFMYTYASSPSYNTHAVYEYTLYAPPPHHRHHQHKAASTPKQLHSQEAVVTGHVFCDICKNGQLKEPLRGVTIGITCWNGKVEQSFFGITNKLGNFKVKLSGFNLHKQAGGRSCRAKLIYPAFKTLCMLPTNLNDGKLGASLRIKSKTAHKLVLVAGPFAYTTPSKNKKCHHKGGRLSNPHKHKTRSSHSHAQLQQLAKYKSPSCPVHDCKITPPSYSLDSRLFLTQRTSNITPLKQIHKASSPLSQNFKTPSPIYFKTKKDHKSTKSSHSPMFHSF